MTGGGWRSWLATRENPLLLDLETIARVTGGTWHNVPAETLLTGISFNRAHLAEGTAGNLYFAFKADIGDERFDAESVASVRRALAAGAAAAVVPRAAEGLPPDLPVLKVERLIDALDGLGFHVRDHLFAGKRVLVSGGEGKTAFKNLLRQALSGQLAAHATTHGADLGYAMLASLASIRREDKVAVVEAHPGRLAARSGYLRPHLFALVGEGEAEGWADIVLGLEEGGYGLLNADSANYAELRKSALARRRVPLLTYGTAAWCNGRLLERRRAGAGWEVSAEIEGQRVGYRLGPGGEEMPLLSVGVLLAAYYLGAEVDRAAADLSADPDGRTVASGRGAAAPEPSAPDDSALAGLRPLALADLPRYRAAIDQSRRMVLQHYFPFIHLLGQSPGYRLLVGEDAGSLCIYYLREKGDSRHLCLFVPPLPLQPEVLERCIERLKTFNRSDRANLFRVDADDVGLFRGRANTRIVACPQEYIYAPAHCLDLSGNKRGKLRRALRRIQQRDDLEVRDYRADDAAECRQVFHLWAGMRRDKYDGILNEEQTVRCLEQYDLFPRRDLFGKVIRLDGKIRSFGFAGEIRRNLGFVFIAYSDLDVDGLNRFMWHLLLRDMAHLEYVNGSHADTPGLAFAKRALGPAFLYQPYQVYAG